MWRSPRALLGSALVGGLAIGSAAEGAGSQTGPLPPGKNVDLVARACVICHSLELTAQQRQERASWEAIVDRMIFYGAPVKPEARALILDYLVTHLGP